MAKSYAHNIASGLRYVALMHLDSRMDEGAAKFTSDRSVLSILAFIDFIYIKHNLDNH